MPTMVVIPSNGRYTRRVAVNKVHSIVSNRVKDGHEQYLVRWHTNTNTSAPPLSWHFVNELQRCLEYVQDYLEERERLQDTVSLSTPFLLKRKSPEDGLDVERRASPFDRRLQQDHQTSPASTPSPLSANLPPPPSSVHEVFNGVIDTNEDGFVICRPTSNQDIPTISLSNILTADMQQAAKQSTVQAAHTLIRAEYVRRLSKVPGHPIQLINTFDASTPSLRFRYISRYVLAEGVIQCDSETMVGCQRCSPHMGRDIGCEYTKRCDCLEYAAVDETRLNNEEQEKYRRCNAEGLSTIGLPKKFPYFAEGTKIQQSGALVSFYLNSRRPIYECNDNCRCGPKCRNKNVQFGRRVEVEIFKTASNRGWGLRCTKDLHQGQFIDTYRGEVITDEEADRREHTSSKAKASYLYSLDKFEADMQHEPYVVDGEFMGGPTKFINHSCEPNCRQYTVSYNKNDPHIYDIAFFACRDIPAFEELTFDYLDKEEDEEMEDPGEDAIPCLCGARKCRKWLWT